MGAADLHKSVSTALCPDTSQRSLRLRCNGSQESAFKTPTTGWGGGAMVVQATA